ncbi:hypothetical protein GOP47_0012486 [Adiantum capillus-veneris]|uniref:NAD-dependent epimerase/dehydratase domain-containing protein n=1 Tax=Adiantum capillus-veneris TaxID=13818 RepID=A0A9D4UR41_ADICA|nr:hypothetical protein GOP47_0012486 [Adiantum capillus-veneris]
MEVAQSVRAANVSGISLLQHHILLKNANGLDRGDLKPPAPTLTAQEGSKEERGVSALDFPASTFLSFCSAGQMVHVCVTGGSGFLASWLIKLLLERGYHVRATVRDPDDFTKTAHLFSLAHGRERLELFKADLLDEGCFDTIVENCEGVFHTASPVNMVTINPEEELIKPAVKGTLNVLRACAMSKSVRRVLLTSSMAAVVSSITNNQETPTVYESTWSDQSHWRAKRFWYGLSKLLAEEAALCFAKEKGIDLVTIVPGMIAGRCLQPNLDTASKLVMEILTGKRSFLQNVAHAWVDVRDVAEAHILAFETPLASGRYLCAREVMDSPTLLEILLKHYQLPKPVLQSFVDKPLPSAPVFKVSIRKLESLGINLKPIEDAIMESIECLIERGLL